MQPNLRRLAAFGRKHPFALGVAVGTLKTGAADLCVQVSTEGREEVDWPRFACFTLLGFGYIGCLQQVVYVSVFAHIFPHASRFAALPSVQARLADRLGLRDLVLQTAAVNFLWCPMFLPFFYAFQDLVEGVSLAVGDGASRSGHIFEVVKRGWWKSNTSSALERCRQNLWNDLKVIWQIWIPGHLVTFALPMWLRMPTTHSLSFLYFCVFSFTRGSGQVDACTVQARPAVEALN
mmetsp:Transcript_84471/g.196384  ORF Transcript_84471/g.196384 Transcript_84471/m.196384 type:complete len:235 (-) Transcript_84471:167-871(-)